MTTHLHSWKHDNSTVCRTADISVIIDDTVSVLAAAVELAHDSDTTTTGVLGRAAGLSSLATVSSSPVHGFTFSTWTSIFRGEPISICGA